MKAGGTLENPTYYAALNARSVAFRGVPLGDIGGAFARRCRPKEERVLGLGHSGKIHHAGGGDERVAGFPFIGEGQRCKEPSRSEDKRKESRFGKSFQRIGLFIASMDSVFLAAKGANLEVQDGCG